jgi:hypothetical protein
VALSPARVAVPTTTASSKRPIDHPRPSGRVQDRTRRLRLGNPLARLGCNIPLSPSPSPSPSSSPSPFTFPPLSTIPFPSCVHLYMYWVLARAGGIRGLGISRRH